MSFDPFYLLVIPIFLTIVTILVAAHELGHYLFARYFNMGVEEFAIGFGKKPLWTYLYRTYEAEGADGEKSRETTRFTIRPWPLGGFVRIKGMVPEEDGSEVRVPGGFYSKPPIQRFIVLLMGPVFSILAGWAILIPFFALVGPMEAVNKPVVGVLNEKGPAERAGIQAGDRIVSIDGDKVDTFYAMVEKVRDGGAVPHEFLVSRKGQELSFTVTPELDAEPTPVLGSDLKLTDQKRRQAKIGIGYATENRPLQLGEAVSAAVLMPVKMVESLVNTARKPSTLKENVGGPISMVVMTGATAREGIPDLLFFAGALSVSLGIFNLLPVSPLDGGQMAVAFVEMLRKGRRLSFRIQNWVAGVGLTLVAMLVITVFAADITRFFGPKPSKEKPAASSPSK